MKAAVLHSPGATPRFEEFADPVPHHDEQPARILAAGLHPLVRVQARGEHYTSTGKYPLIPGVDCVAELADGRRIYTGWLRAPYGTFAERAAVPARTLEIPSDLEPARVAGMVNPASASWLALRRRARFVAGESVMVLGATGASGRLAVQIARALGAGRVTAVGRNLARLEKLPADAVFPLGEDLTAELARTDIVLDYLWGPPAHAVLDSILLGRHHRGGRTMRYVNIGQSAGAEIAFSPHALRSMDLVMLGSGAGSIPPADVAVEMPALLAALPALVFDIEPAPLADISAAWERESEHRIVFTM